MREKKHELVKREITKWIASGRLESGARVPTEDELAATFSVSKSPVRQALAELVTEGYIYTLQGSGSYVRARAESDTFAVHALLYTGATIEREIVLGMHAAVRERRDPHLRLSFQHPGATTAELIDQITLLRQDDPGALLLIPVLSRSRELNRRLSAALRRLQSTGWIVVQLDQTVPGFAGPVVAGDHKAAATRLARHLSATGHTRIAVLLDHRERNSIRLRLHGVRSVFPDAAVIEWSPPAAPADSLPAAVAEAIGSVTAVIAFESELSDALLRLLDGAGISVPTDLSVCTFDQGTIDTQRPGFVTHIRQPLYRLGTTAIETALALRSSAGDAAAGVNLLPCRLVVGASTAPPVSTTRG